ncbi:MAG: pyridoxamine 5'-phosphate oxidase family protein [Desulfohalobium sp.]
MSHPDTPAPVAWNRSWHDFFVQFFTAERTAVLATARDNWPYCSLMAYACLREDPRRLVLASPRQSRKVANIEVNPNVSLLIDNSRNDAEDSHTAQAVTLIAEAALCPASLHREAARVFTARHPHLHSFVDQDSTALLCLRVSRFIVVEHFQQVTQVDSGLAFH